MSIGMAGLDVEAFAGADPIWAVADEVFAAMIDGEPGHLAPWLDPHAAVEDEMHAWVDVGGAAPGRVLLTTERDTATRITRALLMMGEAEPVGDEDFRDALGEVANVVGGNVKALVPDPGALTLPQVTHVRPDTSAATLLYELPLSWRGRFLLISLWQLPGA
jgi:chemotaxis protein CheX